MTYNIDNCQEVAAARSIPDMRSVKETAKNFGIAEYYVRQLVLSGQVKAIRAGKTGNGKILVNQESLAQLFNSSYITSSAEG